MNKQANPTVALAGALPPGSNTQQVTAMLARIQNLGDKHEISEVCDRQKLRTTIRQLLDEKYDQLDQAWKQNFIVGSKVMVKWTGETKKPSWPAEVTVVSKDGFQVRWTTASKMPTSQTVGGSYHVCAHRSAKNLYRCARRHLESHVETTTCHLHMSTFRFTWIRSASPPSRKSVYLKRRKRLASEIDLLLQGKLSTDSRIEMEMQLALKKGANYVRDKI